MWYFRRGFYGGSPTTIFGSCAISKLSYHIGLSQLARVIVTMSPLWQGVMKALLPKKIKDEAWNPYKYSYFLRVSRLWLGTGRSRLVIRGYCGRRCRARRIEWKRLPAPWLRGETDGPVSGWEMTLTLHQRKRLWRSEHCDHTLRHISWRGSAFYHEGRRLPASSFPSKTNAFLAYLLRSSY